MREFAQVIRVVPVSDLPSDFGGAVSQLLTLGYTYHADPFDIQPEPVDGSGGECWDISKDHIIDSVSTHPFVTPVSSLVVYKVSGREEYVVVGTVGLPATVQIVRGLNNCTLAVRCRMLESPF